MKTEFGMHQADAVSWLNQQYELRRQKNQSYSLRAFARDLGMSPGHLSKLFQRKTPLTYRQFKKVAESLSVNRSEMGRTVRGIILQSSPKAKVRRSLRQSSQKKRDEICELPFDRFQVISQWYHLAILELTYIRKLKDDPYTIAGWLGVSTLEVIAAIERLIRLGFLRRTESGRLEKVHGSIVFKTKKSETEIRIYERTMLQRALHALDGKADDESFQTRLMNSFVFPTSPEAIPHLKKAILKFQKSMLTLIRQYPYEQLYQFSCQLLPITPKIK